MRNRNCKMKIILTASMALLYSSYKFSKVFRVLIFKKTYLDCCCMHFLFLLKLLYMIGSIFLHTTISCLAYYWNKSSAQKRYTHKTAYKYIYKFELSILNPACNWMSEKSWGGGHECQFPPWQGLDVFWNCPIWIHMGHVIVVFV